MKRLVLLTTVFLLTLSTTTFSAPINSATDNSLVGASVIDFSGTGQAEGFYQNLTLDSVTFTGDNGLLNLVSGQYAGNYNSAGIHLENPNDGGTTTSFTFSFSSPVSAFGFNFGASNEDWQLSAYDTSASLLESYTLPQTWWSNDGDFFGLAVNNIAFATLIQTSSDTEQHDWILLDNFTYTSAPVPEPATFLLLGSGLAGLAFYRRKRK